MELFVDNFAGGGGASTGIEMAIGRSVDIAINHDREAIAMHKANHPNTKHFCEDVWAVDPKSACEGNPVALAWFSPDCTHFSRAKGGKPVDKNIRGLAWVTVRWAHEVRPRVIMLENVPEIQSWGPLGEDNKPIKERSGETFEGFVLALTKGIPKTHPAFSEMCLALDITEDSEMADNLSKGLGYELEYRILRSCDYGAPTTRTRIYIIARSDGKKIIWPEATHAPKDTLEVAIGEKKPYRTAAECIDWSIPAQSIFEREKPLAENTLRRIARGIKKFVIDNPKPFIVTVNHTGDNFRGQSIDEPLKTVTAKHGYGIVTPTIMSNCTGNVGAGADEPLPTVTTGNKNFLVESEVEPFILNYKFDNPPQDVKEPLTTVTAVNNHYLVAPTVTAIGHQSSASSRTRPADEPLSTVVSKNEHLLVAPTIVPIGYGERKNQQPRVNSVEEPLGTVVSSNKHYVVAPTLIQYHSEQNEGEVRGQELSEPLMTVDTAPRYALSVAHIMKNYGGNYEGAGSKIDNPLDTVTAKDHNSLVTAHILTLRNNMDGQNIDEPLSTVSCSGAHHAEVQSFLVKYFSNGAAKSVEEPLDTITTKDRFALVKICGEDYIITDIKMRVLQPRELFNAQGFPEDYIIDFEVGGKAYPKTQQVEKCGNAVTPPVATALVRANLPEYCGGVTNG